MIFEVEKKFWLNSPVETIKQLEQSYQVTVEPPIEQVDKYFGHPARDFIKTDEVLRLRTVDGDQNFITYKGARIDSTTKTRRELELPLHDGSYADEFQQLLIVLGFEPMMTIIKMRRTAKFAWQDYRVEVCLDEIDQLGNFIEIETTSDLEHLDKAKMALESLAEDLKLDRPERRSYLELMVHHLGVTGMSRENPGY